jgi:hypothetical protein
VALAAWLGSGDGDAGALVGAAGEVAGGPTTAIGTLSWGAGGPEAGGGASSAAAAATASGLIGGINGPPGQKL